MWIAKPIRALTLSEKEVWHQIERQLPLAQSLSWAYATEAVSGRAFLVLSTEEKVGGIVFTSQRQGDSQIHFDCVNGPYLHWDAPDMMPRQLATFAMAVSKLDRNFASLALSPRWEALEAKERFDRLPIPIHSETQSSTLVIPILSSAMEQFKRLSPRLRRTITTGRKAHLETKWEKLTPSVIHEFVPSLNQFGMRKGFSVPPISWFEALIQEGNHPSNSVEFWLGTSHHSDLNGQGIETKILVSFIGNRAHYLFGYENRSPNFRSALSTSAAIHWEALNQCRKRNILTYDLNGYVQNVSHSHPYFGVCKFKEQFAGNLIQYRIPKLVIQ